VAIDARLPDSGQGGVLQVLQLLGLAFQLASVPSFTRTWLVYEGTTWWEDVIPGGDTIVRVPPPFGSVSLRIAKQFPRLVSIVFPILKRVIKEKPSYDKLLHDQKVDVVHIPFQDGLLTSLPTVYHPHDLQHCYFPENFTTQQLQHRDSAWKQRATRATIVMAASRQVQDDLMRFWGLPQDRIRVVPIPPPDRTVPEAPSSVVKVTRDNFAVYPAVFWPHKNHLNLLKAVEILQKDGVEFDLIFTGAEGGIYKEVVKFAEQLPKPQRVCFAGHVSNGDLSWLVANSRFVVVPSRFEAMSLTVWDAQRLGTAVACSSGDPFPDQVGTTALLFDPDDPRSIARVIRQMWNDEDLRSRLVESASRRVEELTMENYGNAMYGMYLEALQRPLPSKSASSIAKLQQVVSG